MRKAVILGAAVAALLSWVNPVQATSLVQLNTVQLVDVSDTVIRGNVSEVWTERDQGGLIWTHAQIEISDVFKGDAGIESIIVEQPGGTWGSHTTRVAGVARFSVGEDAYFFINHNSAGQARLTGMLQGKFNVQMDPYSQLEIVHRFSVAPEKAFDHRFLPLPPDSRRTSADEFENTLETAVLEGWDGQPIPGISFEHLQRVNAEVK